MSRPHRDRGRSGRPRAVPAPDADRSPSTPDPDAPAADLQAALAHLEHVIATSKSADRVMRARRKLASLAGRVTAPPPPRSPSARSLTQSQAYDFARMLTAGLPPQHAVLYFLSDPDAATAEEVHRLAFAWQRSADVLAAIAQLNGGDWVDLDEDRRLQIALDKHHAELAYYLYTTSFTTAAGAELGKLNTARQAIRDKLAGGVDADSPIARFLRDLVDGKTPSQLTSTGLVSIPVPKAKKAIQES